MLQVSMQIGAPDILQRAIYCCAQKPQLVCATIDYPCLCLQASATTGTMIEQFPDHPALDKLPDKAVCCTGFKVTATCPKIGVSIQACTSWWALSGLRPTANFSAVEASVKDIFVSFAPSGKRMSAAVLPLFLSDNHLLNKLHTDL